MDLRLSFRKANWLFQQTLIKSFNPYYKAFRWAVFIFLLSSTTVAAQPFGLKKYTINDGLPDAYILNIFQDSNSFLWIGTANGLSRIDGKEFVNLILPMDSPMNMSIRLLKTVHTGYGSGREGEWCR